MIRLLICDQAGSERAALRVTLEEQEEIQVVGEADNAKQAVALTAALAPDVVLVDADLPVAEGVCATSRIKELFPAVRVVALAAPTDRPAVDSMIAAGADAYCVKGAWLWELERAVAGASDPLLRLAYALTRASAGGVGPMRRERRTGCRASTRRARKAPTAASAADYFCRHRGLGK